MIELVVDVGLALHTTLKSTQLLFYKTFKINLFHPRTYK